MKVDSVQLVMNLNYEILIPENDSVRLLSQIVEEMDLSGLNQAYSLAGKCTKAQGNRRISVSREFLRLRKNSLANVTSEKGIRLRVNSIQAEGAFGSLKGDMEFHRFLTRGTPNIMVEFQLLCLGFNINKLHNKIQSGKQGTILYEVKSQVA